MHARNDVNDPNRPYCESQHSRTPDRANLRNLNNRFDLHRHVEGERRHSDSATCMPTAVAEDLDEQVRATVDDLWVVGKLRHGVYHAEHSAEAYHLIEATRGFPQRRKQLKANVPRVLIGLLENSRRPRPCPAGGSHRDYAVPYPLGR